LLLVEGGRFASSYRIKDQQIMTVNRHMGKEFMTILVLENERSRDGLFLPRAYTVQYWDAATGDLRRTDTMQERWQRIGTLDLPAGRTQTRSTSAGVLVRSFDLTGFELLKSE
jgi:hypothetical protein